jgi:hypothetical protein
MLLLLLLWICLSLCVRLRRWHRHNRFTRLPPDPHRRRRNSKSRRLNRAFSLRTRRTRHTPLRTRRLRPSSRAPATSARARGGVASRVAITTAIVGFGLGGGRGDHFPFWLCLRRRTGVEVDCRGGGEGGGGEGREERGAVCPGGCGGFCLVSGIGVCGEGGGGEWRRRGVRGWCGNEDDGVGF